jgi:hypothetical protein
LKTNRASNCLQNSTVSNKTKLRIFKAVTNRFNFLQKNKINIKGNNSNNNNNNNNNKWNVKTRVIPVIIRATGTISKSCGKYVSNRPGNHEVRELQKTAILGTALHILRKVLT